MYEEFRISSADKVTVYKNKKDGDGWEELRYDDIHDSVLRLGYDLESSIRGDLFDDRLELYFLNNKVFRVCVLNSSRGYAMQKGDAIVCSEEFLKKANENGFGKVFTKGVEVGILSVVHNDLNKRVIYYLKSFFVENGEHEKSVQLGEYSEEYLNDGESGEGPFHLDDDDFTPTSGFFF